VILYADRITDSMRKAIDETQRRRACCSRRTTEEAPRHARDGPQGHPRRHSARGDRVRRSRRLAVREGESEYGAHETIKDLEEEMHRAADDLDFETGRETSRPDRPAPGEGRPQAAGGVEAAQSAAPAKNGSGGSDVPKPVFLHQGTKDTKERQQIWEPRMNTVRQRRKVSLNRVHPWFQCSIVLGVWCLGGESDALDSRLTQRPAIEDALDPLVPESPLVLAGSLFVGEVEAERAGVVAEPLVALAEEVLGAAALVEGGLRAFGLGELLCEGEQVVVASRNRFGRTEKYPRSRARRNASPFARTGLPAMSSAPERLAAAANISADGAPA